MSTYDYIIVGAGPSAMGLLSRLLEHCEATSDHFSVVLIDKGPREPTTVTEALSSWFRAAHSVHLSSAGLAGSVRGRVMDIPIGQGLGGTSCINAGLCIPPSRHDLDMWPEPTKGRLMPAVANVQDILRRNRCLHHTSVDASNFLGKKDIPRETIFPSIVHHVPFLARKDARTGVYSRANFFQGLVEPMLQSKRSNENMTLDIKCQTTCEKLLFKGNRAVGVDCLDETGRWITLRATKEVILCAGAIESPSLLLSSGIGQKEDLQEAGIPRRVPQFCGRVGYGLADHVLVAKPTIRRTTCLNVSMNGVRSLYQVERNGLRFQIAVMDGAVYRDVLPGVLAGMLRFHVGPSSSIWRKIINVVLETLHSSLKWCLDIVVARAPFLHSLLQMHFVTLGVFLLNPRSRGRVKVSTSSSACSICRSNVTVEIRLPYLIEDRDADAMIDGLDAASQMALELSLVDLAPMSTIRRFFGKRFLRALLRLACERYFHFTGTCCMGEADHGAVVDERFRVHAIERLRVCDASVIPCPISAPTALTCAALGRVLGECLIDERRHNGKSKRIRHHAGYS